jgi:hypothetical protein
MQPAHWTRLARLESGQTNRSGIRAAILLFLFLGVTAAKELALVFVRLDHVVSFIVKRGSQRAGSGSA